MLHIKWRKMERDTTFEQRRGKRRCRLIHTPPNTHTYTCTYTLEGGEAVMVGLHPSSAWYWQEQKAHTCTHTYAHTQSCPLITSLLCKSALTQIGLLSLVPGLRHCANWSLQESHCNSPNSKCVGVHVCVCEQYSICSMWFVYDEGTGCWLSAAPTDFHTLSIMSIFNISTAMHGRLEQLVNGSFHF